MVAPIFLRAFSSLSQTSCVPQIISGVGWFLAVISPFVGIYALSQGNEIGVLSAFFSFCTGCAFVLLRRLVVRLEEQEQGLDSLRSEMRRFQREFDELKNQR